MKKELKKEIMILLDLCDERMLILIRGMILGLLDQRKRGK